ncbi:hypothetical protein ABPG77_005107 [Micractinium sp. CCAP 211/92]
MKLPLSGRAKAARRANSRATLPLAPTAAPPPQQATGRLRKLGTSRPRCLLRLVSGPGTTGRHAAAQRNPGLRLKACCPGHSLASIGISLVLRKGSLRPSRTLLSSKALFHLSSAI